LQSGYDPGGVARRTGRFAFLFVGLATSTVGGCSVLFVRTPSGTGSTPGHVSCTTNIGPPAIDATLGTLGLAFSLALLIDAGSPTSGSPQQQTAILAGAAAALVAGASAFYGIKNVSECEEIASTPPPAIEPAGRRLTANEQGTSLTARWRGDFETGDLSQWSYLLNPRGLSIVGSPAAHGGRAARIDIRADDLWPNGLNRVEVQYKPPRATVAEGRRSCFAWRFLVPTALSEARHQIGYWESYPSYQQIMSFEVRGQTIAFVTRLPSERVHWTAPDAVTPAVWHQIAVCAVWSADPAIGAVDVWFDGTRVVTRGPARTLWDNPNFVQIGILRDVPAAPEVMFLDDAFEGANFVPP
jgi:hypothetical protein